MGNHSQKFLDRVERIKNTERVENMYFWSKLNHELNTKKTRVIKLNFHPFESEFECDFGVISKSYSNKLSIKDYHFKLKKNEQEISRVRRIFGSLIEALRLAKNDR